MDKSTLVKVYNLISLSRSMSALFEQEKSITSKYVHATSKGHEVIQIDAGIQLKNGATSAGFLEFFEDSDNGTNKVTLIGPASTADVTVVLPAAADTLVGKATTDTLTNKSIDSYNNTITNIEKETANFL